MTKEEIEEGSIKVQAYIKDLLKDEAPYILAINLMGTEEWCVRIFDAGIKDFPVFLKKLDLFVREQFLLLNLAQASEHNGKTQQ